MVDIQVSIILLSFLGFFYEKYRNFIFIGRALTLWYNIICEQVSLKLIFSIFMLKSKEKYLCICFCVVWYPLAFKKQIEKKQVQ